MLKFALAVALGLSASPVGALCTVTTGGLPLELPTSGDINVFVGCINRNFQSLSSNTAVSGSFSSATFHRIYVDTITALGSEVVFSSKGYFADGLQLIGTLTLPDGSIVSAFINAGAVTTLKLGDGAVTSSKMDANAVATAAIQDSAVTTDKLAADAVTEAKVINGAITTSKVGSFFTDHTDNAASHHTKTVNGDIDHDSITGVSTSDHHTLFVLVDDAVTTAKIANDAVTSIKIADGSVTTSKMASGVVTNAKTECSGLESFRGDGTCVTPSSGASGHAINESSGTLGAELTAATVRTNIAYSTNSFVLEDDPGRDATIIRVRGNQVIAILKFADGASQSKGCFGVIQTENLSGGLIVETVFTSTTSAAIDRMKGVLDEDCDPGDYCKVIVSGPARVSAPATIAIGNRCQTDGQRCKSFATTNFNAATSDCQWISNGGTIGWMWLD